VRRIAVVVYPGLQTLDVVGPVEVFHQASRIVEDAYEIVLVGDAATTTSGLTLGPIRSRESLTEPIDTLMVAGGYGVSKAQHDRDLVEWVGAAARRSRRVTSVCSGAFVLAAAGLLDGRRATTHWGWTDLLARRYPAIDVDPDPIYVRDGDVWTSAGVTAGMDLSLALVEEDLGAQVALDVARRLVLFARRPGGQAQFSVQLAAQAVATGPLQELQAWIAENVSGDLSVAALARHANVSPRTLARAFSREVGMTPAAYVESVRVEQARGRLESGRAPLATIARACGFGTAETMRRSFHRRLGVSPADYRSRFQTQPGEAHADRHPRLRAVHGA